MNKVFVVTKWEGCNTYPSKVVGVFSGKDTARQYCDIIDPNGDDLCIDDYEIDRLMDCNITDPKCPCIDCRKEREDSAYWPMDRGL